MRKKPIVATKKKELNVFVRGLVFLVLIAILVVPTTILAAPGDYEISDGSVKALYHLEDEVDSSGNAYNLTNYNSATFTTGKFSNAVTFGTVNTNKYLAVTNDVGISGGDITINGWINLNTSLAGSDTACMASQGDDNSDVAYSACLVAYLGDIYFNAGRHKFNVSDTYASAIVSTPNVGDWHMLTTTYNGSLLSAYYDGVLIATTTTSGNGSGTNADVVDIGLNVRAPDYNDAKNDEILIANRAFTANEVSNLWNSGIGKEVCVTAGCADAEAGTSTECTIATGSIAVSDAIDNDFVFQFLKLFLGIMVTIIVLLGFPYLWSKLKNRK